MNNLYRVFRSAQLPAIMQGCPCCASFAELKHLSVTAVRELSAEDLNSYLWHAIWTVGSEEDFRHFTPRLLELIAAGDCSIDAVMVAKKSHLANWRAWSQKECAAVDAFWVAYWHAEIECDSTNCRGGEAIVVLGNAYDDVSAFMETWLQSSNWSAIKQLSVFASENVASAIEDWLPDSFWSERHDQMKQVARWLCSRKTLNILIERWFADSEGPLSGPLLETIEVLEPHVRLLEINKLQTNLKNERF